MTHHDTFDRKALEEIKARNIAPMKASDCFTSETPDHPDNAGMMAAADAYLKRFVLGQPGPNGGTRRCICCGAGLTGLMGSFQYGLAHGEGEFGRCRYPARAIHKIDGVGTLRNLVLQYHPSKLSFDPEGFA